MILLLFSDEEMQGLDEVDDSLPADGPADGSTAEQMETQNSTEEEKKSNDNDTTEQTQDNKVVESGATENWDEDENVRMYV